MAIFVYSFGVLMRFYQLLPDELLLRLVRKSDRRAFDVLYERYWEKLYAVSYNRIRNPQECEDIVHDVFVSLWKNRASREISNLGSYLATAVKYKTLSYIRKYLQEPLVESRADLSQIQAISPDALLDNMLDHRMLLLELQRRINQLPPTCQLIFRYSRFEQLNTREIADRLDISHRTVENQLTKALRHLRVYFKDLDISR